MPRKKGSASATHARKRTRKREDACAAGNKTGAIHECKEICRETNPQLLKQQIHEVNSERQEKDRNSPFGHIHTRDLRNAGGDHQSHLRGVRVGRAER